VPREGRAGSTPALDTGGEIRELTRPGRGPAPGSSRTRRARRKARAPLVIAPVPQLAEELPCKQSVAGSTPAGGSCAAVPPVLARGRPGSPVRVRGRTTPGWGDGIPSVALNHVPRWFESSSRNHARVAQRKSICMVSRRSRVRYSARARSSCRRGAPGSAPPCQGGGSGFESRRRLDAWHGAGLVSAGSCSPPTASENPG
jgi:hypothetical protein